MSNVTIIVRVLRTKAQLSGQVDTNNAHHLKVNRKQSARGLKVNWNWYNVFDIYFLKKKKLETVISVITEQKKQSKHYVRWYPHIKCLQSDNNLVNM